jgi:hypothetical protein
MLGLNLDHDTHYPDMFLWFSSVSPDNFQDGTSIRLQPFSCVSFESIIRQLSSHSMLYIV